MRFNSDDSAAGLPPAWEEACVQTLRINRKNVDVYRSRMIKERLMDAATWPNTNALVASAKSPERTSLRDVAERLSLDGRTLERWQAGAVLPHPRTFFGLLYFSLRKEVVDVEYPNSRDVVWDAVRATLRIIRAKELRQRTRRPRRDEVVLMRQFMRHPQADCFAPTADAGIETPAENQTEEVLSQVIKEAGRRTMGPSLKNAAAALSAIGDWALPYALFRYGLPFEMSFMLELLDADPV